MRNRNKSSFNQCVGMLLFKGLYMMAAQKSF